MLTDVKYGLRLYRRAPAFSLGVVLTLALGIGLNTAVFSVVNAVLVRPLSFPDAARLVWVAPTDGRQDDVVMSPDFLAWHKATTAFDRLVGFFTSTQPIDVGDEVLQGHVADVTEGFWDISGARFALGGPPSVGRDGVVLAHVVFERRFRGDSSVVGRPVLVEGQPNVITGVLSADFHPQLVSPPELLATGGGAIDVYRAKTILPPPAIQIFNVIGRLKPGVTIEQARAELDRIDQLRRGQGPQPPGTMHLRVVPYADKLIGDTRKPLLILQGAVGLVLLIVCVNIANLLLVRGTTRQREIAIRAAVGARRVRIFRQFLVEILLLAVAGAAAGLLAAWGVLVLLLRLLPLAIPRLAETTVDARVLLFTLATCVATTLVFAIVPAAAMWRRELTDTLKDAPCSASASARTVGMRTVLVTIEVATTVILLVAAGLMVKSIWRMTAYPPGFAPDRVLTMRLQFSGPRYGDLQNRLAFVDELLRRAAAAPEVAAVGVGSNGDANILLTIEDQPGVSPERKPQAMLSSASEGYAAALGMRVIRGRWLTDREPSAAFVINETLAREAFPGVDPIGKRIQLPFFGPSSPFAPIVGVVADLRYSKLGTPTHPELFLDYAHARIQGMTLAIRTRTEPKAAAPALRTALSSIDRSQPLFDVKPLDVALADSIAPQRLNLVLLGTFAASALVLAIIGIYSVVAYGVAQRRQELGIRIALGASRSDVVAMVTRQAMAITLGGIVVGVTAAVCLTRILRTLLYEVTPVDLATFTVAVGIVAVTALVACWGPAMRASRIDPLTALRTG
jgi:putative ABC transport system permease protein